MPGIPKLAGAYAPVLTPFTSDGKSIEEASYRRHLAFLEAAGLTGVVVLGTNGEFDRLTADERLQLVEATLSAGTALKVVVGGTVPGSPDETLAFVARLAEYADQLAAILVAPPFYHVLAAGGAVPDDEVVAFFRRLARVQDCLGLLLYNVPVPAAGPVTAAVTPGVAAALKAAAAIVGIKDSTGRLENILAYLAVKPGFQVLVGSDHVVAGGLARGAVGSITACGNVFPAAVLAVHQARPGPDREAAQLELSRMRRVLELIPGKLVAAQKLLLHRLGVVPHRSPVRDRRGELTASEESQVWAGLEAAAEVLDINRGIRAQVLR